MKNRLVLIVSLILMYSCGNQNASPIPKKVDRISGDRSSSIESTSLQQLYKMVQRLKGDSSKVILSNNELLMGDTSVRLKVDIEFDGKKDDKWILATNFSTVYKAGVVTEMSIGSIGIGLTKQEALNICIEEWLTSFGIPFTNLLSDTMGFEMAGLKIFPGPMGTRGDLPKNTWLAGDAAMHEKIIAQIKKQILNAPGTIVPVDIKMMVGQNVIEGDCKISNNNSLDMLASLKLLTWPASNSEFMFKQVYLIQKGH